MPPTTGQCDATASKVEVMKEREPGRISNIEALKLLVAEVPTVSSTGHLSARVCPVPAEYRAQVCCRQRLSPILRQRAPAGPGCRVVTCPAAVGSQNSDQDIPGLGHDHAATLF